MEMQLQETDNIFSTFKKRVEDAVGLVSQIPAEQKCDVWKFWELMSETVRLFTQVYVDGVQNPTSKENRKQGENLNKHETKKKRGRPRGQVKKKTSKSNMVQETKVDSMPVAAEKAVVTEHVEEKGMESLSCASDQVTVEDVVSSFNLDFSDLMSIPSSVEGPRSHMSNMTLQSPDPLHIDNVMTPVPNKEEFVKEENECSVIENKDTSNKSDLNKTLTGKENVIPVNATAVIPFEENTVQPVIQFESPSITDEQMKHLESSVRRSRRPRKKKLKDTDIYNYDNKGVVTDQPDNEDDYDNNDDEGEFDRVIKNKRRKRQKQMKVDEENPDLLCKTCGTKLSSLAALTVHKRVHSGDRPYSCKQCGNTFTTNGNLLRHLKTHTGERPFECTECNKRFSEAKTLKVHMRTHTGERPYKCKLCNQSFTQSGVLQNHMHIHTGHHGHLCDWCGKGFRQKSNLTIHVKRHLNSRDYPCEACHYSFFSKGDLARHKLKHSGEKPYLCELCPKSFTRLQYLNEHMNQHLGNKPHTCKKCAATFFDLSTYHRHIRKHRIEEKNNKKKDKEDDTTPGHIIMTTGSTLSQSTMQHLEAVINQEAERIQQQNDEQTYQTIIVSANDSQIVEASDDTSTVIQPGASFSGQEVYHISVDPNLLSNDPSNLIATVDFSAINLLANATTKQFALS